MIINERTAVIDNDFLNHLVEAHFSDDLLAEKIQLSFTEMDLVGVVHPLVYMYEVLRENARIALLFSRGVINKAEFSDIFAEDNERKQYYIYLVRQLYRALTGDEFPVDKESVLSFWKRMCSFGEVHSFAMCLLCGCGIFLSDDSDAKRLKNQVDSMSLGSIDVFNREEFFKMLSLLPEPKLSRDDRRALAHKLHK